LIEFRFHGRGGQGAVLGCEILAKALLREGKYVQYSPDFGVERRGAPVRAFLRVDEGKIYLRYQIYEPDCVVVLDPFLRLEEVIAGLKPEGWLIINTPKGPEEFKGLGPFNVATINATEIALKHQIGTQASPIVNTVILGAIAKVFGFSLSCLQEAIREKFGEDERNLLAAQEAYHKVKEDQRDGG